MIFKNKSTTKGFSFGLTSGIITTLGMIVGLESFTGQKLVIIAGILSIAIADAFSDALGMHVSEEAEGEHIPKEVWEATYITFLAKFLFALTFIVPFIFTNGNLSIGNAVWICVIWGLSVISIYSYIIAKKQGVSPAIVVGEHLLISVIVIAATHFVGDVIRVLFGS